jgi:hypothetical protein
MKHHITSEFEELFGKPRLDGLNGHPGSVYGLDSKFNIAYLNPAWFEFAEENANRIFNADEWPLGRNIFDSIPDVLMMFYRDLFESCLRGRASSVNAEQFEYECSSPYLYRRYSMHLYPLDGNGIVVVHSLVVEESYISNAVGRVELDESQYIDKNGFINQCASCRRIQNQNNTAQWDWIPKWIEKPYPKTAQRICSTCKLHYT